MIEIRASGESLSVYSNKLTVTDTLFKSVGSITVKNPTLAKAYMEEFFNDLRTYTPGTFFKIKKGSTKAKIESDHAVGAGLWI